MTAKELRQLKTKNEVIAALNKGELSNKELRKAYSALRKQVMKQIRTISKSSIPFVKGEKPYFMKTRNIVTERELVSQTAEMLHFIHSKRYSTKDRAATKRKTLTTLRNHGINISDSEYLKWVRFITWFKNSAYAALYDSDSEVVLDVFEEGSNSRQWSKLFREYGE